MHGICEHMRGDWLLLLPAGAWCMVHDAPGVTGMIAADRQPPWGAGQGPVGEGVHAPGGAGAPDSCEGPEYAATSGERQSTSLLSHAARDEGVHVSKSLSPGM